jgi:hypothetical protein
MAKIFRESNFILFLINDKAISFIIFKKTV